MSQLSRIRDRGEGPVIKDGRIEVLTGNASHGLCPLAPLDLRTKYEYMHDTVGFRKTFSNPCAHDKSEMEHNPIDEFVLWNTELGTAQTWRTSNGASICVPQPWQILRDCPLGIGPGKLKDFRVRAEDHFITAVKTEVLLINFLIDIVALKGLLEGIVTGILKRMSKIDVGRSDFVPGETIVVLPKDKTLSKGSADNWLIWNFAIKPFMKDLRALRDMARKLRKRLWFLRINNGNLVRVKYRNKPYEWETTVSFPGSMCFPAASEGFDYLRPADVSLEVDWQVKSTPAADGGVIFDIEPAYLYSMQIERDAQLIYLGLLAFGSTIWEGIPFSFVVDWFLSEKMKKIPNMLDYNPIPDGTLHHVAMSLKSEATAQFRLVAGSRDEIGPIQNIVLCNAKYESYVRSNGFFNDDDGDSVFRIPWSGYILSLALALTVQKYRK